MCASYTLEVWENPKLQGHSYDTMHYGIMDEAMAWGYASLNSNHTGKLW